MPEPEQVQRRSPVPGILGPISSTQVQLEELGLSAVAVVEQSWSHWPLCHVVEEPSTKSTDSHHQSYHSGRSQPHLPAMHQVAPPLSLQCL